MTPISSEYTGPKFCKKCGGVLPSPDECVCQPKKKSDKGGSNAYSGKEKVSVYQGRKEEG